MPTVVGQGRWLMLAVLFLARMTVAVQFQSVGAIAPLVADRYGIDFALLGTLVGLYLLPGVVIALPGGLLGQRFGDKPVAVVGLVLMIVGGVAVALAPTIGPALIARMVSGIGGVLLNVVMTKMLIDWFAGREIAIAMALLVNSWPVGIGLTLLLLPGAANATSSSTALIGPVALGLVALLTLGALYRSPPGDAPRAPAAFQFRLSRREWRLTLTAGLVWMFYNVAFILPMTYGPAFLIASGTSLSQAGPIVSVATWVCAVSVPLCGLLAQRLRAPNLLMASGFAFMALAVVLLAGGAPPLVTYAAFGLASGFPAGLIMALPSEALRPENRSAGMGVFFSCYFGGMAGFVPLAGSWRDATQNPSAPLLAAVVALTAAAISLAAFRTIQRERGPTTTRERDGPPVGIHGRGSGAVPFGSDVTNQRRG